MGQAPAAEMPLRPGEEAKLAPAEEQQLLEKLRREREAKAAAALQSAVQHLSATMVEMDLTDVHAEAKRLSKSDTVLASSPTDAQVALVLNAIMRSCCPPSSKDTPSKGKGGGKKQSNSVRAAAAKVTEGEPPQGTAVRKALKANAHLLAEVMKGKGEAGQFALLRAFQSWVLSPQGANALEHAAKCIEILYDKDLAEEETLKSYWASLSAQRVGEDAELDTVFNTLDKDHGGTLTIREFVFGMNENKTLPKNITLDDLWSFAKHFDNDGTVTFHAVLAEETC